MVSNDELACVYSALILQDDDIAITAEKLNTILKAASVEVEPYWPTLFAKALEGVDLKQLITSVGAGVGAVSGGGGAVAGGPSAGGEAPAAAEEPKKEEKKEESEESDEDMGFGLFDWESSRLVLCLCWIW